MRVHYLQHVSYESIAAIQDWAQARGHVISGTHLYRSPALPAPADFDLLVVMGGPMNIYQHDKYPWLIAEKAFIRSAVEAGKAAIGICLGAQLVAEVLGGAVTRNGHPEIGWFPVNLTLEAEVGQSVFADFPAEFTPLHWHGDTFAIPPGATHEASSAACANQAFTFADGRVVGLQFHLEATPALMEVFLENATQELARFKGEPWVQTAEALASPDAPYAACQALLFSLLDRMIGVIA